MNDMNIAHSMQVLNRVFIVLRELAQMEVPAAELAELLDMAEYLPRLMAQSKSPRMEVRAVLEDLTRRHERFGIALEALDSPSNSSLW